MGQTISHYRILEKLGGGGMGGGYKPEDTGCSRWTGGGPGRGLTNFTSLRIYSYQWLPDGKSLALVRGDSPSDLVLIQESQKK